MSDLRTGQVRRVFPPFVRPSTRQRLLQVAIDHMSVVGFHDVLVNDLCKLSGISRRTFYNYFPGVPELFLVAYEMVDAELRAVLAAVWDASGHDRDAVIRALVRFACADPVRADAFFVQAPAAGRPVVERRQRTLQWCGALLADDARRGTAAEIPPIALEVACGGVWDVVRSHVARGDFAGLERYAVASVAAAGGRLAAAGPTRIGEAAVAAA